MKDLNLFLKEKKVKSILAVMAHADDFSYTMAALPLLLRQDNIKISVCALSKSDTSQCDRVYSEIKKELIKNEYVKSLNILGINNYSIYDYDVCDFDKRKSEIEKTIKSEFQKVQPDAVFTFDASGITDHQDHKIVTAIVFQTMNINRKKLLFWRCPDRFEKDYFFREANKKEYSNATHFIKYGFDNKFTKLRSILTFKSKLYDIRRLVHAIEFNIFTNYELYHLVDYDKFKVHIKGK